MSENQSVNSGFYKLLIIPLYFAFLVLLFKEISGTEMDQLLLYSIQFILFFGLIILMYKMAKSNLYDFCGFTFLLLAIPLVFAIFFASGAMGYTLKITVFIIVSSVGVIACFVKRLLIQYSAGVLPDILREKYGNSMIYEIKDVQLAAEFKQNKTSSDWDAQIEVLMQNTMDVERSVDISVIHKMFYVQYNSPATVIVPAAAVMKLTIPVKFTPKLTVKKSKTYLDLGIDVNVSGADGLRLRQRRAKILANQSSVLLNILQLIFFSGLLSLLLKLFVGQADNNLNLSQVVDVSGNEKIDEQVSLEHQWSIIWEPTVTELHRAMYEVQ